MAKNESEKTSDTFHSDANRFTQSTGSEFVGSKKIDRLDRKAKKSDKKVEKAKQKIPKKTELRQSSKIVTPTLIFLTITKSLLKWCQISIR